MRKSNFLKLTIAIALLLCTGGAAAIAGVFSTDGADTSAPIYQPQAALTTAASSDASLSAALAPMRREQGATDVPAAKVGLDPYAKQHGANRALARLARTDGSGGQVYLVPADGGVCIMSSDYLLSGCRSTQDVLDGKSVV